MTRLLMSLLLISAGLVMAGENAAKSNNTEPPSQLAQKSEVLKRRVIELSRDLFLLEEDLLQPASSRISVYVSLDRGSFFALEGVRLELDGKPVTSFLYTAKDLAALKRGAIQPLYQGNVASGQHELVVFFTGIGPHKRAYKRGVSLKFNKAAVGKAFEIRVLDSASHRQPEFSIKVWQ